MIRRQLQGGVTGRSVGLRYMEVLWLVGSESHSEFEVVTVLLADRYKSVEQVQQSNMTQAGTCGKRATLAPCSVKY